MSNFSATKNKVIAWGILILVVLLAWSVLFYLASKEARETGVSQKSLLDFQEEKGQVVFLNRAVENNKQKTVAIDSYFVTDKNVLPFIQALESGARQTGVVLDVESVKLRDEDIVGAEKSIFSLSISGSYPETVSFLKLIETMPFLSLVETVKMQSVAREGGAGWISNIDVSLDSIIRENEN